MTIVFGILLFGLKVNTRKVIGIIAGFIGTYILVSFGEISEGRLLPAILIIIATCFYALSANAVHRWFQGINTLAISSVAFTLVLPVALIFVLTLDFNSMATRPEFSTSLLSVIVLSLFSTVMASVVFFRLVQLSGVVFASMVSYLIPVVALMWGILDGEAFYPIYILGLIFILGGVYLARS